MNAVLETIGWWLVDFAWLATILLVAAAILRVVLRQAAGRVALVWGTWLSVATAAVLTALPLWPRLEILAVLPRASAPPSALVMASELAPAPLPAEAKTPLLPAEIVLAPQIEAPVAPAAWQLDW